MATLTGDNGLLQKAQTAKEENEEAKELELIKLAVSAAQVAGEGKLNTTNLKNELEKNLNDNDIDNNLKSISDYWNYKEYKIDNEGNVEKYDKLLPAEYQQVEYIESSGTQYIDTRFSPDNNSGLILRLNYTQAPTTPTKPFGVYYNDNAIRWYGLNPSDRGNKWSYGWNDWNELDINFSIGFHEIIINLNNNHKAILDNQPVYSLPNCAFGTGKTAYLFALNGPGTNNVCHFSKVQLYSCEIFDKNKEARDFIPCYSTTTVTDVDGIERQKDTIGLYDTVERKFYVNKGTGTFGYGMEDGTYVTPKNN